MIGQLIILLGSSPDYVARFRDGRQKMWTPQYLTLSDNPREMLVFNIRGEKDAIEQYRMHMRTIDDASVNAVLLRIIRDEEYHVLLQALLEEL